MVSIIANLLATRITGSTPPPVTNWVLFTGTWNDTAFWSDTSFYKD